MMHRMYDNDMVFHLDEQGHELSIDLNRKIWKSILSMYMVFRRYALVNGVLNWPPEQIDDHNAHNGMVFRRYANAYVSLNDDHE